MTKPAGFVPALLGSSNTLVLGEAPGQQEVYFGCPFVGTSGQELYRIFADGGLVPAPPKYLSPLLMQKLWKDSGLSLANVIPIQPPKNRLAEFCATRSEAIPNLPAMVPGKYLRKEFEPYLDALRAITTHYRYIIACGNTASILTFFASKTDFVLNPFPLVWHKTDNTGVIPDPNRGPRRIYETAFMGARGDRFIVEPVANVYGAPTTKIVHPSEKPEPMLRHFFRMFVDEHTKMFDPTCGGGSAVRASASLGAKSSVGWEIDPDFADAARKFRGRV